MLIECPECQNQISDKAISCPRCGFPVQSINSTTNQEKSLKSSNRTPQRKKKHMKLPNGFGSIRKLTGNRRRPYAAYPPAKEFKENGVAKTLPAIGYYEDWYQALEALQEYNRNPYDIKGTKILYKDLYKLMYTEKFVESKKEFSVKTKQAYNFGFNNSSALHDKVFAELRKSDYQNVLDSCTLKHASLEQIKMVFTAMNKFAMSRELITMDHSKFAQISIPEDDESGEPFSPKELKILWNNSSDKSVKKILIMIYTGYRIKAFESLEYNEKEQYYKGGVKTQAGKGRIVPISDLIIGFVNELGNPLFTTANRFRADEFTPTLERLGISITESGKKHTPHDTRHTFSWLCDKYKVDELSKHLLMGHSLGNDVEKSKYGHRTFDELKKEIAKIKR